MTLPTRNLDDRTFQDIVDEAKKRIAISCPTWSDHNVSDPGITLIELFAWMTEMILYRLNQVPEKNYIKFMELLGLRLREPEAARTQVTFYLSAPQPQSIVIPQRTEVATVRTETNPAISFSTSEDLEIQPPALGALFAREASTADGSGTAKDRLVVLQQLGVATFSFLPFGKPARISNAFYLGFENDVSNHVLGLEITCPTATSRGIDPANPPWRWEGWHGGEGDQRWLPVVVETDGTGGMSYSGRILLRLPRLAQRTYGDRRGYWVRCQMIESATGRNYDESPVLGNLVASSWGGTVSATNASVVHSEMLGRSDGAPGQIFHVEHTPLLQRARGETLEVQAPGEDAWESWSEVPDFGDSGPFDKHFTCDSTTGEVRFGPALRHPDGTSRAYGAIPPRNASIRFAAYRYGGGVAGNIQAGTLTVLKTSIPYVERVVNHLDATGGMDLETLELAKLRAPQLIRSRGRAVTASDFETLARLADSRVQRARCIPPRTAGQVFLLLVPQVNHPAERIMREQLKLVSDLRDAVQQYLDDYRLLTVQVDVREPQYAWVAVEVVALANPDADPERVRADIEARLYRFLNPIVGGHTGDGWLFGRALYPSDVYSCLQSIRGIEFIESLRLYQVKSPTGDWAAGDRAEITGRLEVLEHALIASAEHRVTVKNASGG